jgi:hypothetical protein
MPTERELRALRRQNWAGGLTRPRARPAPHRRAAPRVDDPTSMNEGFRDILEPDPFTLDLVLFYAPGMVSRSLQGGHERRSGSFAEQGSPFDRRGGHPRVLLSEIG